MEKHLTITHTKKVSEFEFWKDYFRNFETNKPDVHFTEFELDALACIMTEDIQKSPLKNQQRIDLVARLNKMGYKIKIQNVHTRIVVPFASAGILFKSEDDEKPGEYSIHVGLKKIQKYIRSKIAAGNTTNVVIQHNLEIHSDDGSN